MSGRDDRSYHEARSLAELECAQQASDPAIAAVHRELAALHKQRMMEIVHLGEPQLQPQPIIGLRQPQHDII